VRIGLAYDLKTAVAGSLDVDDALEEYDSPETLEIISAAIESIGHKVVRFGGGPQFFDSIRHEKVDIVFNIAEGRGSYRSREAQIPSILEMLDIPYTGSDPHCLAVCLDKPITKKLVAMEGIHTPIWLTLSDERELHRVPWDNLVFPVIVKPAWEGSSKGIHLTSLVHSVEQAQQEARKILGCYRQPAMVEEFIDGDEVTVGVIGNTPTRVLGMMRVLPKNKVEHFIYSVEVKRDYLTLVDYECPVSLPENVTSRLESASLRIFKFLGCRDFSRIDFRIGRDGMPYFIEINPLPGLGSYSDLIIMAEMMGWTHTEVIVAVLDAALERYPRCVTV
jgi:D-alanine-D-alanine ligase